MSPPSASALPERIHGIIGPWVSSQPDAIAVEDMAGRMSYAGLAVAIEEAAGALRAAGLRPGDRLLVVCENCSAAVVLVFAASRLNAWAALVNARLSPREIDTFMAHSGARLSLFLAATSGEAAQHAARLGAATVDWPGVGSLAVAPRDEACLPEALYASAQLQVAALVYTSGTSGHPKGVMLSHGNLIFVADNNRVLRGLRPGDRVYGVLPLAHVYGLTSIMLTSLHCGATLVLAARFDPRRLARALAEEGITVLHGVPAIYAKLLDWAQRESVHLRAPQLRIAQAGGAPLDQALKDDFERTFGVVLHNGYGMTETAPTMAQTRLDAPRRDCSVGPPVPRLQIRILDKGVAVAPGQIGELHVRGPSVMRGYYRDPDQTREVVDAEGWLNTGDLVRQDADGALHVVGRSKELIIRSGFNVYPVEVEQVLNAHPLVVHSAVVGRRVPNNEEVVAYVEPVAGAGLTVEILAAYLRDRLSPYKQPAEIVLLEHLPATPTGKILKNQLRQLAAAARVDAAGKEDCEAQG